MSIHVVKSGECLSTIAAQYGFADHGSIYNHPANAALRTKRPNPHVLHPGDEVVIPERTAKVVVCATGASHRFMLRRPTKKLKLKFMDEEGQPLAYTPYVLSYDREWIEDLTNADGELDRDVPLSLGAATVDIDARRYQISIGGLNPLGDTDDDGLSGLQQRLRNLGIAPKSDSSEMNEQSHHAIAMFQLNHDLPVTGHLDEGTRIQLERAHGS